MKKYLFLSCMLVVSSLAAQELVLEEVPVPEEQLEAPSKKQSVLSDLFSFSNQSDSKETKKEGNLDDLYTLLDAQGKSIQELTERLEQSEHRLKLAEEKLDRINQDIAFRLTELEAKQQTPAEAPEIKQSDLDQYNAAFALLKNREFAQSEKAFSAFLKNFPDSDLIPNALYWLGETYYVQGQYEQAVGQFADVFTKHPQSNKAPDALLKMGLAMVSLNKKQEACTAFIALPNEYPKAPDALKKRANEEAQKNQCS